jgi:hypothetical protein
MKQLNLLSRTKAFLVLFTLLSCFSFSAQAQYSIVVNGPSEICGPNLTSLSISPLPTGLTVNWYKYPVLPPFPPYFTGPVLSAPETGNWVAEIVVSSTPVLQTVTTQTVTIRTNTIFIESELGITGNCTTINLRELASTLSGFPIFDFYQWKKNGVSIPGANSYLYGATTSGVYTCTASLGCGTGTSNPITLTIGNPPTQKTVTASGPLTFCQGGSVTLTVPPTAGLTYQWQRNNVDIPGATSTSYIANQSGTYKCREISVYCGSISSTSKVVTVNPLPTASIISAQGPTTFCAGGSVVLAGNNSGGVWNVGGSTSTLTVTTSGTYYVTNTNSCGSVNSNQITVTVNPLPVVAQISSVFGTGPVDICAGTSVQLYSSLLFGGVWNIGGSNAPSIIVSSPGDYFVTTTNSCGSVTSNHILVSVTPIPVPAVISANGPTTFCVGGSVTLSGNANGGAWSVLGTTAPSVVAQFTGDYFVTNTNLCGVATSNHIFVTVDPQPVASISGLSSSYNCMDAPVTLVGSPSGGILSGVGISGNTFNPNVVGTSGGSSVYYNYYGAANCSSSYLSPVVVSSNYNCAVPQNLSVSNIAKKTAVISWNSSAAPSFKIRYRKTGSTTYLYKNITWTACSPTSVQLTGLISNTNYTVDVKTVCTSGSNTYSQSITFRTLATNPVTINTNSREIILNEKLVEESPTIQIFPNPFEHNITIQTNEIAVNTLIEITDLGGRVLYKTQTESSQDEIKINTSDWQGGIYFVRFRKNEQFENYKLIKH